MISPPHKHDVLKNKKKTPKGSQNAPNGSQSAASYQVLNSISFFFFLGGGGIEKMISPPHKHVLKHLKKPSKGSQNAPNGQSSRKRLIERISTPKYGFVRQ